ncbi:hypothetical protein REC12_17235 [Desulfosporosinus sp. PR]|uniref:hypothetical protein n=1 Tax=Candidatus Desulfosporosinus nitrosoreducens TaxID=3401928 RepID=UPI0027F0D3D6|nr:hypothetical protein [Desulfosporosinus sp. PR]MDQ7095337.1 hypothetical protein [Desulfosporosinus sp. PR]
MREWKDLTRDEKEIITVMKNQGITPEDLIQRMRSSGRMNEQSLEELKKALEDVRRFLLH